MQNRNLTELMQVFNDTDADIVGKRPYYVYFESIKALVIRFPGIENMYVDYVSGGRRLFKRKVFGKVRFRRQSINEDVQFCKDCRKKGYKIYSADKWNHVYFRGVNLDHHTWKVDYTKILQESLFVTYTEENLCKSNKQYKKTEF